MKHHTFRMRREVRRRNLTVSAVEPITPQMRRIRFSSPELRDFESLAPDDHIKLFFPSPGNGSAEMRDYTPRAYDRARGELTIDFALHQAGPATAWALAAAPGDALAIGGPRGSHIVDDDFDWYLLVGDETALPAIGRRVEALRPGVPVTTVVIVESDAERQVFATQADWTGLWVTRAGSADDDATLLRGVLRGLRHPAGDGYVWIAGEARLARSLRAFMLDERAHPRPWVKASGYWARGRIAAHEPIED